MLIPLDRVAVLYVRVETISQAHDGQPGVRDARTTRRRKPALARGPDHANPREIVCAISARILFRIMTARRLHGGL